MSQIKQLLTGCDWLSLSRTAPGYCTTSLRPTTSERIKVEEKRA